LIINKLFVYRVIIRVRKDTGKNFSLGSFLSMVIKGRERRHKRVQVPKKAFLMELHHDISSKR
jgi:hypothetical protein